MSRQCSSCSRSWLSWEKMHPLASGRMEEPRAPGRLAEPLQEGSRVELGLNQGEPREVAVGLPAPGVPLAGHLAGGLRPLDPEEESLQRLVESLMQERLHQQMLLPMLMTSSSPVTIRS